MEAQVLQDGGRVFFCDLTWRAVVELAGQIDQVLWWTVQPVARDRVAHVASEQVEAQLVL